MNRRAVAKLGTLPFAYMPFGTTLVLVAWVASLPLIPFGKLIPIPFGNLIAIPFVGMTTWLVGMLIGMTARTLMRTESRLLPDFSRIFAGTGLLYALVLIALPTLLMLICNGGGHDSMLLGSTLLLAAAVGLAAGMGIQLFYFIWIIFPVLGFLPADMHASLLHLVMVSPWIPLLVALLAIVVLRFAVRPLLIVSDPEADQSPMQAITNGRKQGASVSGTPQRRGFIARKLQPFLDATAERNLQKALAHLRQHPGQGARMRVIRAVLLPHDNVQGVLINTTVVCVFGMAYFLLIDSDRNMATGFVASYAILVALARFSAAGQGLVKMQPNLADLYMTLAPRTHSQFQATIADALLKLVAVATFNCVIFTLLIALFLHISGPGQLLLTALIVGVGASFGALAVHLIGPTSKIGRAMAQMAVIGGAMVVYNLVLWLMHDFGTLIGGLAAIAICLPFGLGAWRYARREYSSRRPCFEAPLD